MTFLLRSSRFISIPSRTSLARLFHKDVDAISEFTDELLSKRQLRLEIQQQQKSDSKSRYYDVKNCIDVLRKAASREGVVDTAEVMFLSVDFEKLDRKHVDHLIIVACRDNNKEFINKYVEQCIVDNKDISENSVLTMCEYFSSSNDNRILIKLIDLCKSKNRTVYDQNCEFSHFIARSLWAKGNSDGALSLLDECYQKANISVRLKIRSIFRFIVEDTVSKKSEAVLVRLIRSAVLLQQTANEPMFLAYIWKKCFLSTWFSDQQIANQLFNDNEDVRTIAAKRRGLLCYKALCDGNVDVVHRLIQAFLKFKMKEECRLLLELLFEYHYVYKNLRACSEILKTTLELDITLCSTYDHKLLNLLMGGNCIIVKPKKNVIPKFNLKF